MANISDMRQHVNLPQPNPNLSDPHLGHLQQSFAEHVLKWFPLFDPETASQHLRHARDTGYRQTGASLCVVFLIFTNGAISADNSLYLRSPHDLPGFVYYARAVSMLERLPITSKDLTTLQCRLLVGLYLLFAMRSLEAWTNITQASQNCVLFLKENTCRDASQEYREAFRRIYWYVIAPFKQIRCGLLHVTVELGSNILSRRICYVLETELEACLDMPTSGIRTFQAVVPLPGSRYEEEGMYFLLAISSLRTVMVDVLDAVGYRSATPIVSYNPAVPLELRRQLDEWYCHLPGPLRFRLDSNMLFDSRKAYLRCAYHALIIAATWPFVMPLSQASAHSAQERPKPSHWPTVGPTSNPFQESMPQNVQQRTKSGHGTPTPTSVHLPTDAEIHDVATGRAAAQTCLDTCRSYLIDAEEILMQRSVISHLVVHQYFAFTMILLLDFSGVDPQDGGANVKETRRLERALHNLRHWSVAPFMAESLNEIMRIARAKGLRFV
ncbi:hypothetical protein PMZ80_003371 [Knufia obscura]|uniref:Transcription factor domain-containing protein n=2 Tax=Knufia TaxID=430999 RepID=A0AAN8EQK4_9EURO|nr:hypothetical protein PMZ80_003371 [Knufia obscura]KAK5956367.1 hypothetical protein OHC33_002944 [Knufia fluminis]